MRCKRKLPDFGTAGDVLVRGIRISELTNTFLTAQVKTRNGHLGDFFEGCAMVFGEALSSAPPLRSLQEWLGAACTCKPRKEMR